jgi:hypothetical protein
MRWPVIPVFIFLIALWPGIGLGQGLTCGICGKIIEGEYIRYENGPVYHRDCHDRAARCKICGLPIGRHQPTTSDKAKRIYHRACYKMAPFCKACGLPIMPGQSYRKAGNSDEKWHEDCFNNSTFCSLTGKYIRPGTQTVQIGHEIFLKSEYDKAPKCIVSALPVANHGQFIVNGRTGTHVLESYKSHTRQCYSCGDWLMEGYLISNDFFLCNYCYAKAIKNSGQTDRYLKQAKAFFQAKGIRLPADIKIEVLPPGKLVQDQTNTDMKGACHTLVAVLFGKPSYKHRIEILYGLNPERFAAVLIHELSHAVIAEHLKYASGRERVIPYEEGRCEYAAYRFASEKGFPDYIIAGFSANRVDEYREGFLYYHKQNPVDLNSILTIK